MKASLSLPHHFVLPGLTGSSWSRTPSGLPRKRLAMPSAFLLVQSEQQRSALIDVRDDCRLFGFGESLIGGGEIDHRAAPQGFGGGGVSNELECIAQPSSYARHGSGRRGFAVRLIKV